MKKIYKISPSRKPLYSELSEAGMKYTTSCYSCGRNQKRLNPLSIKFTDERLLGDFCWLSPDVFVSERCKVIFDNLKDQGFKFEKPIVVGKRQENIWHLDISNRCFVSAKCGVQLIENCSVCGDEIYSTWIGGLDVAPGCNSSIFRLKEHPGFIFVDESIKDIVDAQKLTNIEFTPITQFFDEFSSLRPIP
jgi:hypothetical protein